MHIDPTPRLGNHVFLLDPDQDIDSSRVHEVLDGLLGKDETFSGLEDVIRFGSDGMDCSKVSVLRLLKDIEVTDKYKY